MPAIDSIITWLMSLILVCLSVYTWVPSFIIRILKIGAVTSGDRSLKKIALTFDDGPDPEYTPIVLDILKKHRVKATFFVLGQKAQLYPSLIERMKEEGHDVGVHGWRHLPHWFLTPRRTATELERSRMLIQSILNVPPSLFRPPWGLANGFALWRKSRHQYELMLWSIMTFDWSKHITADKIRSRILRRVRPGSIILLHDSGQTWGANRHAPLQVIKALPDVIEELKREGWDFATAGEVLAERRKTPLIKKTWKAIWKRWELVVERFLKLEPVVIEKKSLFRVRTRIYKGSPLVLREGISINHGDKVIELHLNNEDLEALIESRQSFVQVAVALIREVKASLPILASYIKSHPAYADCKAVFGVTLIHRGADILGFTVMDVPGKKWFRLMVRLYLRLVMSALHIEGPKRLLIGREQLEPKALLMSTQELYRLYAVGDTERVVVS